MRPREVFHGPSPQAGDSAGRPTLNVRYVKELQMEPVTRHYRQRSGATSAFGTRSDDGPKSFKLKESTRSRRQRLDTTRGTRCSTRRSTARPASSGEPQVEDVLRGDQIVKRARSSAQDEASVTFRSRRPEVSGLDRQSGSEGRGLSVSSRVRRRPSEHSAVRAS
jgi:hypothetical protein